MARTTETVLVVGTGLLGTSIGLGLRALGVPVLLTDASPSQLALAADYGAGEILSDRSLDRLGYPGIVVVCVPPEASGQVVLKQLEAWPEATVTDVTSVKSEVERALRSSGADLHHFVGSHPMAGRERGGAVSGRADLFVGRPWVIAPLPESDAVSVSRIEALALDLEAQPVRMLASEHDRAVALVSHVPQIISTLLAGRLNGGSAAEVGLAGQGLRDTTRLAASDTQLWLQILEANAGPVTEVLRALRDDLDRVIGALDRMDERGSLRQLAEVFEAGRTGVARIPGKHGTDAKYASLIVMIDDRPGELARLLDEIGQIGINMEDIRLEHSPGAAIGLAEIWVVPEQRDRLVHELEERQWRIAG